MTMDDDRRLAASAADRAAGRDCLRCGAVTEDEGIWTLGTGGSSGLATAFLGAWAEAGEDTLDVHVTACPACGHLELRVPRRDG